MLAICVVLCVNANMPLVLAEARRATLVYRRPEEKDEAVQEASVALVKAMNWYDPDKRNPKTGKPYEFSTLAVTLMRNQLTSYFRKKRREFAVENVPETEFWDPEVNDMDAVIHDAMRGLYVDEREILHKRYWEGLTFRDIGKQYGCSGEQARLVHNLAIERLRKMSLPNESQSL